MRIQPSLLWTYKLDYYVYFSYPPLNIFVAVFTLNSILNYDMSFIFIYLSLMFQISSMFKTVLELLMMNIYFIKSKSIVYSNWGHFDLMETT